MHGCQKERAKSLCLEVTSALSVPFCLNNSTITNRSTLGLPPDFLDNSQLTKSLDRALNNDHSANGQFMNPLLPLWLHPPASVKSTIFRTSMFYDTQQLFSLAIWNEAGKQALETDLDYLLMYFY